MNNTNIRYIVDDVENSIEFYKNFLGFEVKMHPAPGFAALERDNLMLFLNQSGAGGVGQDMPDGTSPEPGGWNRIQIAVDGLESFHANLTNKGASFRNEIVEGKGGKQVLLEDPSGNPIELFESTRDKGVQPIPEGYHTITPYLVIEDVNKQIDFIEKAFDGEEVHLTKRADGSVMHAEMRIGNSIIMMGSADPKPCSLHLYVKDVDAVYKQAIEAGGLSLREPADQFYGDRSAGIKDGCDNTWWLATHIEEVSDEEIKRREKEFRKRQ